MNHPSEQDLVLYFYHDLPNPAAVQSHLAGCASCAEEFVRLHTTLSAIELPVPAREPDYEARLWSTLRPRLGEAAAPRRRLWAALLQPRRWITAGALAMSIVAAFLAGRITRTEKPPAGQTQVAQRGSGDRVLMVAVGDHLDRTEMILVELSHVRPEGRVDISAERDVARSLVSENRLYRETAERSNDPQIAGVLDQVERVLIDIAHRPDSVSGAELEQLQKQIESQGVLFKMRVIESKVKARSRAESHAPAAQEGSRL